MVAKNSFVFTNKALEKLSIPVIKRSYYYDTTTRGLALYVTATGVKTFFVYRRVHGRPERIIIGRINEVTLEQARAKAGLINAQIADGKNPQAARRAIRQDITLGEPKRKRHYGQGAPANMAASILHSLSAESCVKCCSPISPFKKGVGHFVEPDPRPLKGRQRESKPTQYSSNRASITTKGGAITRNVATAAMSPLILPPAYA